MEVSVSKIISLLSVFRPFLSGSYCFSRWFNLNASVKQTLPLRSILTLTEPQNGNVWLIQMRKNNFSRYVGLVCGNFFGCLSLQLFGSHKCLISYSWLHFGKVIQKHIFIKSVWKLFGGKKVFPAPKQIFNSYSNSF